MLAATSHHAGGQSVHAQRAVQIAADRLTHEQVAAAWTETKLGHPVEIHNLFRDVPLRYRSTHQEGDAIIVAFNGPNGRCIDLVSRPESNAVMSRRC